MSPLHLISEFLHTSWRGVDHNIPGNGGEECYKFSSLRQRASETIVFTIWCFAFVLPIAKRSISLPQESEILASCRTRTARGIYGIRKVLLITLCLVFGVEIGFKCLSETWIYLLNPCHVITVLQIYLLSSEPSRFTTAVFRIHIHLLFGPLLASILPVTNTRDYFAEVINYWVQHILVTFVVPPFLLVTGGAFTCEPFNDLSWVLVTIPIFGFYMFYLLQGVGMLTLANLNNMLCPAISDPFHSPYYRWFAIVHQQLLIMIFGKLYSFAITSLIKKGKDDENETMTNNNGHGLWKDENKDH